MVRFVAVLTRLVIVTTLLSFPMRAGDATLGGRVVDEDEAPVRDASVTVSSSLPGGEIWKATTGPDGVFSLTVPVPGDYLVTVEREGYYVLKNRALHLDASQQLTFALSSVREVFQSANISAETSPVDVTRAETQERLTGTEINDIPYANSHNLRNALPLMPGVIEERSGPLHVNGSSENQVLYLLNGFNITNPISGQFQTVLAVDGIRSVDVSSGSYSPKFGKGSAGTLAVNTQNGTDTFHYTATDFIPGLRLQQGLNLSNWDPRLGFSGPIVRGRAWFSDTFNSEYSLSLVNGLPKGQNTGTAWAGSNLLHTQVNVTPSNIFYADFLVNVDNAGRVGLGPLTPISTTSNVHQREYLGSVKDQAYLGHGVLLEVGYAHNDFSNYQYPQGSNLYLISPEGSSGNYFLKANQSASRDQGLVQSYLPQFRLAGTHQLQAGIDVDALNYSASFSRTGYQVLGLAGQLLSETVYPSPASFRLSDTEFSSWLLDTWRISKQLQFTLGVRQDWDRRIANSAWAPRLGFSWSPFKSGRTRIGGGYAITHDIVPLDILGRPFDQTAFTTPFTTQGSGPPEPTTYAIGNAPLVLPRATNWTISVDHQLAPRLYVTAKYLRRRETDGFAFINTLAPNAPPYLLPLPESASPGIYQLTNQRRDNYDSAQVSVRQSLSGQFEWMASYTRSRTVSNAVLDPNTIEPLQVLSSQVPVPWDAPNRFLAWAYLPLPWKYWAVSGLADMRSGFPFSVRDAAGLVSGGVDSYRYPLSFDLNLAVERMLTFHGYRFALRLGADNVTNQTNPTAVYSVIGTPQFLHFLGFEGRHYVLRIRFFGRATGK